MTEQQVYRERAAQVKAREEERQQQQQEERLFQELWDADCRAKEEQENAVLQSRRRKDAEKLSVLRSQMEEAEQRRQQEKKLEEEAQLLVCSPLCETHAQNTYTDKHNCIH